MKNAIQSRLGFTLIELLVVVLIIGILAAVALPQYQQAVEKSRASEALANISSFRKAVEVWKLANPDKGGTFAKGGDRFGELDIDIPSDWVQVSNGMIMPNADSRKSCSKNFCYGVDTLSVDAYRANSSTYKYGIKYSFESDSYRCIVHTDADVKFCNSLSNMRDIAEDF